MRCLVLTEAIFCRTIYYRGDEEATLQGALRSKTFIVGIVVRLVVKVAMHSNGFISVELGLVNIYHKLKEHAVTIV